MNLPYDRLREAILQELNRAICTRCARGVSFDVLGREYGLSSEALYLIVRHNDRSPEKRVTKTRVRSRPKSRVVRRFD